MTNEESDNNGSDIPANYEDEKLWNEIVSTVRHLHNCQKAGQVDIQQQKELQKLKEEFKIRSFHWLGASYEQYAMVKTYEYDNPDFEMWEYRDPYQAIRMFILENEKITDLDALLDYLETELREFFEEHR